MALQRKGIGPPATCPVLTVPPFESDLVIDVSQAVWLSKATGALNIPAPKEGGRGREKKRKGKLWHLYESVAEGFLTDTLKT